jgi:hypothetical protein
MMMRVFGGYDHEFSFATRMLDVAILMRRRSAVAQPLRRTQLRSPGFFEFDQGPQGPCNERHLLSVGAGSWDRHPENSNAKLFLAGQSTYLRP